MKNLARLLYRTGRYWWDQQAPYLSAGLTYYTLTSLAPLLIVLISIASLAFDAQQVTDSLTGPMAKAVGEENVRLVRGLADAVGDPAAGVSAGIVGALLVMMSASILFQRATDGLNQFWSAAVPPAAPAPKKPLPRRALEFAIGQVQVRVKAFLLALGAGILLLATLAVAAGVGALGRGFAAGHLALYWYANQAVSIFCTAVLFALIYRYVPQVRVPWKYIWAGAFLAAVIYTALQSLMSVYVSSARIGSAYGAAASLVVILFWVYYSIQGMFLGAALTIVLARREWNQPGQALPTPTKGGAPLDTRPTNLEQLQEVMTRTFPAESRERGLQFQPRPDDVIISPYAKCGTTWLQQIAHGLRTRGNLDFEEITEVTPWIEVAHTIGWDLDAEQVAQPRLYKSHLAYHDIPKGAKYIVSFREPKSAFVSFYRFFEGWLFEKGSIGLAELARWRWPREQMDSMGYWYHLNSWWEQRENANVLLLCYEDMKADLPATVEAVARFMGIELDDKLREIVLRQSSWEFMSANKHFFDDKYMRRAAEERGGIPALGRSHKVSSGVTNDERYRLPPNLDRELDEIWREQVEARWGFRDYAELRGAVRGN